MAKTTSIGEVALGRDGSRPDMVGHMMRSPIPWLAVAGLVMLTASAHGQDAGPPPVPDRNPAELDAPAGEMPTPPEVIPDLPGDKPTVAWTDAEVAAAKAACAKQLSGVVLDYEPLAPIKDGICGAPAPILVSSIGAVAITPPATMRCALAVKLDGWLKSRVQPKAKSDLGSAVVTIRNATSYSCRNRYGGANTPISEHALANALDISEFVLASGERVTVIESWPRAVPSPEPEPIADDATAAIVPVSIRRPSTATDTPEAVTAAPSSNPFVAPDDVRPILSITALTNPFVAPVSAAVPSPQPKPPVAESIDAAPAKIDPVANRRTAFLRGVHADACKIFGTVLGPEANEAHKDHFHLDMKSRRHANYCE
jgi:hypothetical protein